MADRRDRGCHVSRNTVCADLRDRATRLRKRDGVDPTELPLTLDEWFWLSEALAVLYPPIADGTQYDTIFIPTKFRLTTRRAIPLKLVESVKHLADGGIKVVP